MKKRFNQDLLKEELNKFRLLSEYDFYTEKKQEPTYLDNEKSLAEVDGEAEKEIPNNNDVSSAANNVATDLGVDNNTNPDSTDMGADMGADMGDETTSDIPEPGNLEDEPMPEPELEPEPSGDEVEVDVTSLVKGSEEAKQSADKANQNSEMLLQKLSDLEARLANMTAITDKIENLEQEIIKRNPTPVEKLEMRSLSSYPFNQKLTDYWADKEGAYDVMGKNEPKEFVLKKDDVDATYSDSSIQKSFTPDINNYKEEDISNYYEEDI